MRFVYRRSISSMAYRYNGPGAPRAAPQEEIRHPVQAPQVSRNENSHRPASEGYRQSPPRQYHDTRPQDDGRNRRPASPPRAAYEEDHRRQYSPPRHENRRSLSPEYRPRGAHDDQRGRGDDKTVTETVDVGQGAVSYLLGRNGATKLRLSNFSGCHIEANSSTDQVTLNGNARERDLARLCIRITLQQRDGGKSNPRQNCKNAPPLFSP